MNDNDELVMSSAALTGGVHCNAILAPLVVLAAARFLDSFVLRSNRRNRCFDCLHFNEKYLRCYGLKLQCKSSAKLATKIAAKLIELSQEL
jgi:hypothetical protein